MSYLFSIYFFLQVKKNEIRKNWKLVAPSKSKSSQRRLGGHFLESPFVHMESAQGKVVGMWARQLNVMRWDPILVICRPHVAFPPIYGGPVLFVSKSLCMPTPSVGPPLWHVLLNLMRARLNGPNDENEAR